MPVAFVALAAAALGLGGVLAIGAPAHADDPTYSVTGTITGKPTPESSAVPLDNVLIELHQGTDPGVVASTTTGVDGTYEIDFTPTEPTADYTLDFNRSPTTGSTGADYVHEWLGSAASQATATSFPLSVDVPTQVEDAELTAGATVSGTVTDGNGDPVEGATVQANPPGDFSGESTTTDASGGYTLRQVRATDTIINTYAVDSDASHQYTNAQVYYNSQYWQGADEIADATPLAIVPGEATTDIDFALTRQSAIHQLITDPDDQAIPCVGFAAWVLNEATGSYEKLAGGPYYTGRDGYLNLAVPAGSTYKILYFDNLSSDDPQCPGAPLTRTEPFESRWYGGTSLATATAVHVDGETGQIALPALALEPFSGPISLTGTPTIAPDVDEPSKVYLSGLGVSPGDSTLSFQWLRDDVPIDGDTNPWHTLVPGDQGTILTVHITAARSGYSTQTFTSAPLDLRSAFSTTPIPTVTGNAIVGSTLTADPGTWAPTQDSFGYQWLRGGTPIPDATASTYVLTGDDLGALLQVAVTAHKVGFDDAVEVSTVTDPIGAGTLIVGAPTISGSPTFGATLTVDPGSWGPGSVALSYQWVSGSTDIPGATSAMYAPTANDVGHRLWVRVSGSAQGYTAASVNSAQTAGIGAATFIAAPRPTISGTTAVGQTLTADPGTWSPGVVTFAYQWLNEGVPIDGATAITYTLTPTDVNDHVTVRVTGSEFGFTDASSQSLSTAPIDPGTLTQGTATITGSTVFGQTLVADPGTWAPSGVTFSYQWVRGTTDISGATASTYALVPADVGSTISVKVTGSKVGYSSSTSASLPTAVVVSGTLVKGTPTISGTFVFGSTLSAVPGTWTPSTVSFGYQWRSNGVPIAGATSQTYILAPLDVGTSVSVRVTGSQPGYTTAFATASGSIVGPAAFTTTQAPTLSYGSLTRKLTASTQPWVPTQDLFTYQWLRNASVIPGATGSTYTLAVADSGTMISVVETGTKAGYAPVVKTSLPYSAGTIQPRFDPLAEVAPTVSGQSTVGQQLTTTNGAWGVTPDSYTYQWARGTGVDTSAYPAIPGATSSTYTLVSADAGLSVVCRVTAVKSGYDPSFATTQVSSATDPVELGSLTFTTPTITHPGGAVQYPQTLTAVPGVWGPAPALTYQWLRGGIPILTATSVNYALQPADVGQPISVRVTGAQPGYESSIQDSTATSAILPGQFTGTLDAPTVTGTPQVGRVLTAADPTWSPATAFSHQWLRDGVAIAGATLPTYTSTAQDRDHAISVVVTSVLPGYAVQSRTSAETSDVVPGTFTTVPKPTITGTNRVGSTLTAHPGIWVPSIVDFTYEWKIGTVTIGTGATYVPVAANIGHTITVTVSSGADGYIAQHSVASTATAKIVAGVITGTTPTITGTARVGQVLTAATGAPWAPASATLHYQWLRAGKSISGATHSTYSTTTSDYKRAISVKVSGTLTGYTTLSRTSRTITISTGVLTVTTPTITGTAQVGSKLSAVRGTWGPGTVTIRYQWYLGGSAVSGATTSTYTLSSATRGKTVSVRVTGSKTDYTTLSRTSVPTAPVTAGVFTTIGVPSITGLSTAGSKLTAHTGTWSPTTSVAFAYQWYTGTQADGSDRAAISKATATTFTPSISFHGYLFVRITATRAGFTSVSAYSAAHLQP
ncbi:MAG: hypothetical protein QOF79_473 [Actinomycetota bacterium]|nr:hypothetical protein [Actinomycetota bacterium]